MSSLSSKLDSTESTNSSSQVNFETKKYKLDIVWRNVLGMLALHVAAALGTFLHIVKCQGQYKTVVWYWLLTVFTGLGVTAGAHRLWCHRCYKAKWSLRLFLAICQTIAGQNDIYEWCRDHRVHHKYSETDADPHNSHRGFFFAHMGWLLCRKHPEVKEKGKLVNLSDLWSDPIVRFQRRFYFPLLALFWFAFPVFVPIYFWKESFISSALFNMMRYVAILHQTWLVNSAAHLWGRRPYDKSLKPVESSFVTYLTAGEGYHNYHHVFPYDYSASEYGCTDTYNLSTAFIDMCARFGLAYDLKKPSQNMVDLRVARTGDVTQLVKIARTRFYLDMLFGNILNTWPLWAIPVGQFVSDYYDIADTNSWIYSWLLWF